MAICSATAILAAAASPTATTISARIASIARNTNAEADTVASRWPSSTRGNAPTSGWTADAAL